MPTINDTAFTPTVLPTFGSFAVGDDFRTSTGAYKVKVAPSAAFEYATLSTAGHSDSEVVEKVKAELVITKLV